MSRISTHVLDTATGCPAAGLGVRLERLAEGAAVTLASTVTDEKGRIADWLPAGVSAGQYRLVFDTGGWFRSAGRTTLYPHVVVELELDDTVSHYHLPLLIAPFGYSTYRGT